MNWHLVDPHDAGLLLSCALFTLFGLLVVARNLCVSCIRRGRYDEDADVRSAVNLLIVLLMPMSVGLGVATFLTLWRAQQ